MTSSLKFGYLGSNSAIVIDVIIQVKDLGNSSWQGVKCLIQLLPTHTLPPLTCRDNPTRSSLMRLVSIIGIRRKSHSNERSAH